MAKSVNGGAEWMLVDTRETTNPITTIAVQPGASNIIYASGYKAGFTLAKSINGGTTWFNAIEACDDEGFRFCSAGGFYDLSFGASGQIYAGAKSETLGASKGVGIFRSADGGANWTATNMPVFIKVYLAIDPLFPSTIYATGWGGGAYKSMDSGANWAAMNNGLGSLRNNAIVIDPVTHSTI